MAEKKGRLQHHWIPFVIMFVLTFLIPLACQAPAKLLKAQQSTHTEKKYFEKPIQTLTPMENHPLVPFNEGNDFLSTMTISEISCDYSPVIDRILGETTSEQWIDWIEKLSGAETIFIAGEETRINTRFSPTMFSSDPGARAFDYLLEIAGNWYPIDQIAIQEYPVEDSEGNAYQWKNLVITLPGAVSSDQVVILSAHIDSTSKEKPELFAPGAEDNGSGSATLIEAARIFRNYTFQRTIKIVWFTGEEQGLLGSRAYINEIYQPEGVIGVVNLDMFGFDSDNDRCFELHVGTLPHSQRIGQCFVNSIKAYRLDLPRFDYLVEGATGGSDHSSFWDVGIGAVELLEDMDNQELSGGCPASDPNPNYHSSGDTVDHINPQSGFELVKAALASVAAMAGPME